MYKLIDGKKLADEIIRQVTQQIIDEKLEPQLAAVLVGSDPASKLYVKLKERACKGAGITFNKYALDESISEAEIIATIKFLNSDAEIDAILIQLPLPKKINQQRVLSALDYRKDVDGFLERNIKGYLAGRPQVVMPALSLAIWNLVASTGVESYKGRAALIVAKSTAFTSATCKMLLDNGLGSAEAVHPANTNLAEKTRIADVLITAIGKPRSITANMVRDGAIIIDVGISKVAGKTVGDVDFEHVAPKTSFITPVPGGVGPVTVAMLLYNTVALSRLRKHKLKSL